MNIKKFAYKKAIPVLLILMVFSSPIIIYILNFGFHLTQDHQRWAEFGTFIAGIYAPVLSLITLIVLVFQYRMQNRMNEYQVEQTTINRLLNDNTQFLESPCRSLASAPFNRTNTAEEFLNEKFFFLAPEDLTTQDSYKTALKLYLTDPKLSECWMAINSNLKTFDMIEGRNYRTAFVSEQLRVQATLSHGTCASLDNFLKCLKVLPPDKKTYFSEL